VTLALAEDFGVYVAFGSLILSSIPILGILRDSFSIYANVSSLPFFRPGKICFNEFFVGFRRAIGLLELSRITWNTCYVSFKYLTTESSTLP
jgi:hypothetical protein